MSTLSRHVSAPRGATITCKGWPQEAALRMLMNNLDPEVAERPDDLVVYGGSGRAARSWDAFDAIVATLHRLEHDETLVVQSGKPVAVFRTHPWAPRVLIANALLVPAWATWEHFRDLEDRGLTMYGQMTAGSWIYIGTQGILQGTYETLAELARRHFRRHAGRPARRDRRPRRHGRRAAARRHDERRRRARGRSRSAANRAPAGDTIRRRAHRRPRRGPRSRRALAARLGVARSIALEGNAADVLPELARRGVTPDVVTDQTSAHDALNGYVPNGMSLARGRERCAARPRGVHRGARWPRWPTHVRAMLRLAAQRRGRLRLRQQHPRPGAARRRRRRVRHPGFVPEYIRPLFCQGKGPFRWAALSGDPADIEATDDLALEMFAHDEALCRWIRLARERVAFQGLPARIFWLGYGERARFGLAINDLVRRGVVKAPIVIGRDHLDAGSVASPNRETEAMRDGSDAIADWPVLNALLNTASGATWVSMHHGGGVGIGYSLHAGMVVVADGIARGRRQAGARADVRPRARGRAPRGRRLSGGNRHGAPLRHRHAGGWRIGTMMIPERPSLERRVLDRARRQRRAAAHASPSCSAAAAPGGRRCCCASAICSAAMPASTSTSSAIATTPERLFSSRSATSRRSRFSTSPRRRARATSPRDGLRRDAGLARHGARARRCPGDVPARRVPGAAHVRELPRPALGAARSDRGARRQRQPLRPDVALLGARPARPARCATPVRDHATSRR